MDVWEIVIEIDLGFFYKIIGSYPAQIVEEKVKFSFLDIF
jgi:hypothetical protein